MSVANILGADGKISSAFLPPAPVPSVTNPLTANLDCSGFEVAGASYVRTDVVECETLEPKLLGSFIECVADLQMGVGAEIRSELVKTDQLQVREGVSSASLAYGAGFNELKLRPADDASGGSVSIQQGGGAVPKLNFYDVSAGYYGEVSLIAAGALKCDSDLRLQKANPALSFADLSGAKVATLRYNDAVNNVDLSLASGIGQFSVSSSGGAEPNLFLNNTATGSGVLLSGYATSLGCDKRIDVTTTSQPGVRFIDTSGTPIAGNVLLQRIDPSNAILQCDQNLVVASAAGQIGIQRIGIQPGAAGKFIVDGLTVTNTLPTLPNDSFITLSIGGVDYQLALKRA